MLFWLDNLKYMGYALVMKTLSQKVVEAYTPHQTTLREVGRVVGIDHHRVKRILEAEGVAIVKGKRGAFTDEHRANISKSCKGRKTWNQGRKMPKNSLYKNMIAHLRFDVELSWIEKFEDIEKMKFLNSCISKRKGRFEVSNDWYISYVEKFYNEKQFNRIYNVWITNGKEKYLRPTIDHINPRANKGGNGLENLQFLTWFENRAKCDMTQSEWDHLKTNMNKYLV